MTNILVPGVSASRYLTVDTRQSSNYTYYNILGPTSYYRGSTSNGTATAYNKTYYAGSISNGTAYSTYYRGYTTNGTSTGTRYDRTYYRGSYNRGNYYRYTAASYGYRYNKTYSYTGTVNGYYTYKTSGSLTCRIQKIRINDGINFFDWYIHAGLGHTYYYESRYYYSRGLTAYYMNYTTTETHYFYNEGYSYTSTAYRYYR